MRGLLVVLGSALVAIEALSGFSAEAVGQSRTSSCTITLAGAVSASIPCTVTGALSFRNNKTTLGVTSSGALPSGVDQVTFTTVIGGAPSVGAYAESEVVDFAGEVSGSSLYLASRAQSMGGQSLVLTSVAQLASNLTGITYTLHGTLDVTLPSVGGAGGTVTAHVVY